MQQVVDMIHGNPNGISFEAIQKNLKLKQAELTHALVKAAFEQQIEVKDGLYVKKEPASVVEQKVVSKRGRKPNTNAKVLLAQTIWEDRVSAKPSGVTPDDIMKDSRRAQNEINLSHVYAAMHNVAAKPGYKLEKPKKSWVLSLTVNIQEQIVSEPPADVTGDIDDISLVSPVPVQQEDETHQSRAVSDADADTIFEGTAEDIDSQFS